MRTKLLIATLCAVLPDFLLEIATAAEIPIQSVVSVSRQRGSTAPKQYIQAMQALELTVERTFRLTQTMAVRGPAQHILELLESEWVTKIEPDQPITAIKGE